MTLLYAAYSSLDLDSANSVQTYFTCRELAKLVPDLRIVLPKSPRRLADSRGLSVRYVNKLPLRWLLGRRGEAIERQIFARRVGRLARAIGGPVYTRDDAVAAYCARMGTAVVLEIHSLTDVNLRVLAGARCVVALNEVLAANLRGRSGFKRIEVIPDAFDAEIFYPRSRAEARQRLGIDSDTFVVGYAGLTFAGRGVDFLLSAFDRLHLDRERRLILIGGREGELERLGLASRREIIAPGPLPSEGVAAHLAAADALVVPDVVGGIAASPLKMFEYAALGIPIIAPDGPAVRSILGVRARYFAPKDAAALSAGLADLAANAEAWRMEAERLRQEIQRYSYAERARKIVAVVKEHCACVS